MHHGRIRKKITEKNKSKYHVETGEQQQKNIAASCRREFYGIIKRTIFGNLETPIASALCQGCNPPKFKYQINSF